MDFMDGVCLDDLLKKPTKSVILISTKRGLYVFTPRLPTTCCSSPNCLSQGLVQFLRNQASGQSLDDL